MVIEEFASTPCNAWPRWLRAAVPDVSIFAESSDYSLRPQAFGMYDDDLGS